jgi:hypothetical protein
VHLCAPRARDAIKIPKPPRLVSNDASVAALLDAADASSRGFLLAPDEAISLLHKAGIGTPMRSLLLKGNTGSPMTVDRAISRYSRHIEAFGFSLLLTTQPEVMRSLPFNSNDGLFARFLWIGTTTVLEFSLTRVGYHGDELLEIFHLLRSIGGQKTRVGLDPKAATILEEAGRRWDHIARGLGGIAQSWFTRAPSHALRLALVLTAIEVASRGDTKLPPTINKTTMVKAIRLMDTVFVPNMWAALDALGQSEAMSTAERLLRYLHLQQERIFNRRDLLRSKKGLFGSPTAFNKAVDDLINEGVLRPAGPAPGSKGRPRLDVEVNPYLLAL